MTDKIKDSKATILYALDNQWFLVVSDKIILLRRKWDGSPICCFYDQDESIDHLFFTCAIAKVIGGDS